MTDSFSGDFEWQAAYIPEVKRILAAQLNVPIGTISEASPQEDMRHNTDLYVGNIRVSCRLRRQEYLSQYPNQFTFRAKRPSGADTEFTKMLSGWGDYFFYGFEGGRGLLADWWIGDLKVFRVWFYRDLWKRPAYETPGLRRRNRDGSSDFFAFNINDLPSNFVISREVATLAA